MKFLFRFKLSAFDAIVVLLCCIAYGHALFSTAIGGFWSGPDFDHPPRTGLSCLLSGWFWHPLEWLANPFLLAAAVLLLTRHRGLACCGGVLAFGLACQFQREFPADLLMQGYYSWLISMAIFVIGSFCSVVIGRFGNPSGRIAKPSYRACQSGVDGI
jgi:di/tricarboxylate transporter